MSQLPNQTDADKQQMQGCKKYLQGFSHGFSLVIFLILLFYGLFAAIRYLFIDVKSQADINNLRLNIVILIIGLVGAVGTYLQWLVPREDVQRKLQLLSRLFRQSRQVQTMDVSEPIKADYFVSYSIDDPDAPCMKEKVVKQLEELGRSSIPCRWDGESDFMGEIASADEKANRTLTILSPDYQKKLRGRPEWIQAFKQRHKVHNKGQVLMMTHWQLEADLASVDRINFQTLDDSEILEKLTGRVSRKAHDAPLGAKPPSGHDDSPSSNDEAISNVSDIYNRNSFFTGRDNILEGLYERFRAHGRPQAITGLSGMGKTQTVVEYAYRYASRYKAVLWINASIYKDLESICKRIIALLDKLESAEARGSQEAGEPKNTETEDTQEAGKPKDTETRDVQEVKEPRDAQEAINSVRRRLKQHETWLLILDKCDDLEPVRNLTSLGGGGKGDILLTTRRRATEPIAHPVYLEGLAEDEGALFLLRRIKRIGVDDPLGKASSDDQEKARKISKKMGGLPLGLEHAGAYIDINSCRLSIYLNFYEGKFNELFRHKPTLKFSESALAFSSEEQVKTIATTWSVSFRDVERNNQIAAELLLFCAFLSYGAVPEEIFTTYDLGRILQPIATDPALLNDAVEELRKYSLIDRSDGALIVHPLVRAVIKEGMMGLDDEVLKSLAERTVKTINAEFPDVEFANWHRCKQHLPSVRACRKYINRWKLKSIEAIRLLYVTGHYLLERAEYEEAGEFLKDAKTILEAVQKEMSDKEYPELATCLRIQLAEFCYIQGNYEEAKDHLETVRSNSLKPEQKATILNNLGRLYDDSDLHDRAEPLYKEAFKIRKLQWEQNLKDPNLISNLIISLNDVTWSYFKQSKFDSAKLLYEGEALDIFKRILGSDHPFIVQGRFKTKQYRYYEQIYSGILAICVATLEPDHPYTLQSYAHLATFYATQKKYDEAERLYKKALRVDGPVLGDGVDNNDKLNSESDQKDRLRVGDVVLGIEYSRLQIAARLNNLAELYRIQGRYPEAEQYYQGAEKIYDAMPEHIVTAYVLDNYVPLLKRKNTNGAEDGEIKRLTQRVEAIQNKHATSKSNLGSDDQKRSMDREKFSAPGRKKRTTTTSKKSVSKRLPTTKTGEQSAVKSNLDDEKFPTTERVERSTEQPVRDDKKPIQLEPIRDEQQGQ